MYSIPQFRAVDKTCGGKFDACCIRGELLPASFSCVRHTSAVRAKKTAVQSSRRALFIALHGFLLLLFSPKREATPAEVFYAGRFSIFLHGFLLLLFFPKRKEEPAVVFYDGRFAISLHGFLLLLFFPKRKEDPSQVKPRRVCILHETFNRREYRHARQALFAQRRRSPVDGFDFPSGCRPRCLRSLCRWPSAGATGSVPGSCLAQWR